jgi:triosephosphate isomerase
MVGGSGMTSGRQPFIAGNWKMNTDLESAVALASEVAELTKGVDPRKVEIALCPPFPFIRDVKMATEKSSIKIGAQTSFYEVAGAYTGAVSAPMLKSVGCDYALVGHSERRKIFRETDVDINHALAFVQQHGVTPILCIGESKEEYELGLNEEICVLQLRKDLKELTPEQVSKIVIAYEPVWAIGSGLSATPEIAQGVHFALRRWIAKQYGKAVADKIRILYGGSVTAESVDELMRCPDIDGCLVGGASLTAKSFARICMYNP